MSQGRSFFLGVFAGIHVAVRINVVICGRLSQLDILSIVRLNANHLQRGWLMLNSICDSLKAGGKKLTKARKAILAILEQTALPITAAEVHERLRKAHTPVDLVTVYRNLSMLQDLGLVNQIGLQEGHMRYEVRHGRAHHHHIQCRGCGEVIDLMLCPLKKLTKLIEEQTKFSVDGHALEFFGWCPQCR